MADPPVQKEVISFQESDFISTEGEGSQSIQRLSSDAIIQPLHQKLDAILAMLEKLSWDKSLDLCESQSQELIDVAPAAPEMKHLTVPKKSSKASALAAKSSDSHESQEVEEKKKKHRKLSAQDVLQGPGRRRRSKEPVGASVDFATWTEQVRQRCHFDAGALSRGLQRNGSKEMDRSHVPSIHQMNGAFVQAVTMSKADRHAHFSAVEEHIDFEMERLGRRSSDSHDDEDPSFPGLVPQQRAQNAQSSPVKHEVSGSENNKVPTLVSLSNKSQAGILAQHHESKQSIEVGQLDSGSNLLLSSVGRLFWLMGPLALLASCGTIAMNTVTLGAEFRFGPAIGQLIYGLAAPSGGILLRMALRSDDMTLALDKLQHFVADFMVQWKQISGTEGRIYVAAWVLMLLCFATSTAVDVFHDGLESDPSLTTVRLVVNGASVLIFGVTSFFVTLVAYVQSHILLGLDRSLDCWCCSILNDSDFALGVDSWNCLQALLKCIGRGIGSSFLASQLCGAIGLIYILASVVTATFQLGFKPEVLMLEGVHALPLLVFFALNMRVCAHGAALTEKCRVIPAFVNQIPTQDSLDPERQYLVRYVTDSSAGFFVKDAKLTREMFLKNFVTVGGLLTGAVGVLSRIY